MKAECFAHVDALCLGVSRPHQELGLLAPPQPHSSGAQVHAEHANLIKQLPPDSKTRPKRRRFRAPNWPGFRAMIEPHKDTVNQWQGFIPDPPRFRSPPVRQNASAKVTSGRKTTNCFLIGRKPAGPKPYIVVRE